MKRGPVQVDEALEIAKQIALALEDAHEKGIVHRDLKPANIKVRPDGVVKVLDFGLAKALAPEGFSGKPDTMNSPTLTTPAMTRAGMIMGTAAYMSPEQARGKTVDKRADVWAFGAVLFELLTGERAFQGEEITDTILSVISKEPSWPKLPATTSAGLRRLLARCLRKDPKARLQAMGEARVQIEELLSGASEDGAAAVSGPDTSPAPPPRSVWSRALPWAAAAVLAAALGISVWAPWRSGSSPRKSALRFTPLSFEQGGQTGAVWSPDGKAVAFGARQRNTDPFQVYVRYLDSPVAIPITQLDEGARPIEWTSTGRIVFGSTKAPAGLWSVSPVGGEPEPFQAFDGFFDRLAEASVSRDGMAVASVHAGDDGVIGIWINSPPGAAPKPYGPAPFASKSCYNWPTVRFSPDGKQILLIWNPAGVGEEAWLMPYPANTATPPHRVLEDVPAFAGTPTFSWMPDNRHVVLSTTPGSAPFQLYIADTVSGAFAVLSSGTTAQRSPAVSPDGTKLVFVESATDRDVVSVDLATAAVTPLIATQRSEMMPAWASKEPALVYVTDRNGAPEICLHKPGQQERPVVTARDFPPDTTQWFQAPSLSPDATRVIYTRVERNGSIQLWMSAVAGGAPVRLVKASADSDFAGSWSPDGNWFVYWHSPQAGKVSLNKVKTTGQAEPEVVKADVKDPTETAGAWVPVWSPSGDWILYEDGGVKLISPDGKTTREVSSKSALAYAFSTDGKTIYGIREVAGEDHLNLFSMSVAGGPRRRSAL